MPKKKYVVDLSKEERKELLDLTKKGEAPVRQVRRAQILLLSDEGKKDQEIADALHVRRETVGKIRQRFVEHGLKAALHEKPRPGAEKKLDPKAEAYLVALACSQAPEGRELWTMQMLADKLVELKMVESLSDETVRRTLKKTNLSPGRRSNGA